jgi:hypothetical protein
MSQALKRTPEELPASFGRYRLVRLLGKGGMGSVYLAHDTQLDRPVALKIPQLDTGGGTQVLARFYREARAAAALNHPNICPIHDVGEVAGVPYLTMAYIEGKPLGEFAQVRPLLPRQSAALVRKLALALQEAHKHAVIHRDLKPATEAEPQRTCSQAAQDRAVGKSGRSARLEDYDRARRGKQNRLGQ